MGDTGYQGKGYRWWQEVGVVYVHVPLEGDILGTVKKAKDISIDIEKKHMKVKAGGRVIIDKELWDKVDEEESNWELESDGDKKEINIVLEKRKGEWWKAAFVGEEEIDVEKIPPPEVHSEELSDDARQTLDKMMYDQKAKAIGLPTVEEKLRMENIEKLKKQHPDIDLSGFDLSGAKFV